VKVADDGRQCGGNDGLVEGGEEQSEKERPDDEEYAPRRQVGRGRRRRRAHWQGVFDCRFSFNGRVDRRPEWLLQKWAAWLLGLVVANVSAGVLGTI
jgi:hypothetical protein